MQINMQRRRGLCPSSPSLSLVVVCSALLFLCCASLSVTATYSILDFGAVPNDSSDEAALANTKAIQQAFGAASKAAAWMKQQTGDNAEEQDFWKEVLHYSDASYTLAAEEMGKVRAESPLFYSNGSTVLVPADMTFTILYTPITDASNVLFSIEGSIVLSKNQTRWHEMAPDVNNYYGAFQFINCESITIRGKPQQFDGKNPVPTTPADIDGQGYDWWWAVILGDIDHRPHMFYMQHCKNFVFINLYVRDAPMFHYLTDDSANFYWKENVIYVNVEGQEAMQESARKLKEMALVDGGEDHGAASEEWNKFLSTIPSSVLSSLPSSDLASLKLRAIPTFPLNTDGIDPSADQVLIEDFYMENYDDAVAVKPGKGTGTYTQCAQNMMIRHGTVKYSVGLTIGSVPPNKHINCVRNITFDDIEMITPFKALYIKTNPGDVGFGVIDQVSYLNVLVKTPLWYPIWVGPQQQKQPHNGTDTGCSFFYPLNQTCPTQPRINITNILFQNVTSTGGLTLPGVFLCDPSNPCKNIILDSVSNDGTWLVQKDYVCKNIQGKQQDANPPLKCLQQQQGDMMEVDHAEKDAPTIAWS